MHLSQLFLCETEEVFLVSAQQKLQSGKMLKTKRLKKINT